MPFLETMGISTIGTRAYCSAAQEAMDYDRNARTLAVTPDLTLVSSKSSFEANWARIPRGSAMFSVLLTQNKEVPLARTKLGHFCAMPCSPAHLMNTCELFCVDEKIEWRTLGERELYSAVLLTLTLGLPQ